MSSFVEISINDHQAGVGDLDADGRDNTPSIHLGKRQDRVNSTDSTAFDTSASEIDGENTRRNIISKKQKAGQGKSKSAMWARKKRQEFKQGKLTIEPNKFQSWKQQILCDDRLAEFYPKDPCQVRHSACGHFISVN
jgi:hypothetical protein